MNSPRIEDVTCDLIDDHAQLDEQIVRNSNAWYHLWVDCKEIEEDMTCIYRLTQSNTELGLWVKCTDVYNDVEFIEQGGPLILYYVIHDIQDTSDSCLTPLLSI